MKVMLTSLALLLGSITSVANAQVIYPKSSGSPIVEGGVYAAGTTFAHGMAYPPGVTVAGAATGTVTPGTTAQTATDIIPASAAVETYPTTTSSYYYSSPYSYSYSYPRVGVGYWNGNWGVSVGNGYNGVYYSNYGYGRRWGGRWRY